MYRDFERWLDAVLKDELPESTMGIGFNLYEDSDKCWSIQLIAAETFDEENEDWMCDEIFTSGENLFSWEEDANWEDIFAKGIKLVKEYLYKGRYGDMLKKYEGIGIGFVDGDVEIVYKK